jgi:phosphatidylserine/phosphatidylglycerophosphate/cardiolipin synthase-like enzyme
VISDRYQTSGLQKQALDSMAAAGIMIKLNRTQGSMHLKMSIIDKTIVTLGSYNYTQSGSKYNDEVLTVIKDPEAISGCIRQFEDMWKDNKNYSNYR